LPRLRSSGHPVSVAGAIKVGTELLSVEPEADPRFALDLVEAKYRLPRRSDGFVCRSGLVSRLDDARARPLVLVSAPAGYGKTTLLAQWSERDGRPVAWVTLDQADADPAVLAGSIATALARTGPLRGRQRSVLLVLDEAHIVHSDLLGEAVLGILGRLPEGSQVAVASRCEALPHTGRMRGHRMLVEIGAGELAMSAAEAASLLRSAGLELEFTAVQDLVKRTEGWPVALELAALSLAAQRERSEGDAAFAGDDHLLAEYFRAEFLAALSPSRRRFLTRSSVLDRLCGPLCDAVLDDERSASVLAELSRSEVPLWPIDPSHEWYRLHGLFREMLRTELRRAEPEMELELQRRAGAWHRRAGDVDRAIDHALRAGDVDHAGELLWVNLPRYLGRGRSEALGRWMTGVGEERAAECAPFALAAAHHHLAGGDIALAEQWARSAAVASTPGRNGGSSAVLAGLLIIEAWAARSGAKRMGEDAGRAYELLADDSPWGASCCFLQGTASLLVDAHGEAERCFERGAARAVHLAPHMASLCLAQLAVLAIERDDPEVACEFARRASAVIDEHDLGRHPTAALVFAVSAAAGVREGRVDEAKDAAARCVSLLGGLEEFAAWYCAETRILLARGSLGLGDVAGAREQLARASRVARRTPDVVVFERWFEDAWEQFDKRAETALVGMASLTTAELRVLRFLPTHYSFHEIAERLHVSSNTVKTHVHAVYRKLDASSRSQAVANATHAGLLGW
jgi:LuxR family transcriptional regulator, maltose regulon positive regulatory protein